MEGIVKIQNKKTKQFSAGGQIGTPGYSKNGRAWKKVGHMNEHLRAYAKNQEYLNECEIVQYELVEVSRTPLADYAAILNETDTTKKKALERTYKKQREESIKRQISDLQKELNSLSN